MTFPSYSKPYITPAERVVHLQARGLHIADASRAEHEIEQIGYERLRIYFRSRRQDHPPDRPFRPGTTYQQIIDLYECDAALRSVCFDAVGRFEILLRNALSETLSRAHGAHPYLDLGAFKDAAAAREALRLSFDIVTRSKDPRIVHYYASYGAPMLPPIWTLKETLMFGTTSRLLKTLAGPIRTAIAAEFGVRKDTVFTTWVECLCDLRNVCAHHDRLFNRSFQKQVPRLDRANVPTSPPNKLKASLECLDHMLASRGVAAATGTAVASIIATHPAVEPAEVGY